MNEIETQVILAQLQLSIDNLTKLTELKFKNLEDKMDAQAVEHEREVESLQKSIHAQAIELHNLKDRVTALENAPARNALANQNRFGDTLKAFVIKTIVVGIVVIGILLVASVVGNPLLIPSFFKLFGLVH